MTIDTIPIRDRGTVTRKVFEQELMRLEMDELSSESRRINLVPREILSLHAV